MDWLPAVMISILAVTDDTAMSGSPVCLLICLRLCRQMPNFTSKAPSLLMSESSMGKEGAFAVSQYSG